VQDWAARWGVPQSRAFLALREIPANPDFLVAPRPEAEKKTGSDTSMHVSYPAGFTRRDERQIVLLGCTVII
jgi:hypothetical protein